MSFRQFPDDPVRSLDHIHGSPGHLLGEAQHLFDLPSRDSAFGQLDSGLDHRQDEPFDAVSVVLQVPPLGRVEAIADPVRIVIGRQQVHEAITRLDEQMFVMPERVVRVEADEFDHAATRLRNCRDLLTVRDAPSGRRHRRCGRWSTIPSRRS